MSNGELLNVEPLEMKFPVELKKLISCTLQLTNKTENHVAFKVKTTNPKKYCVRPNNGIVMPGSTTNVVVTMQAQKEVPADMQCCRDKFLLQSVVTTQSAVTAEMFDKENGHVEEHKLKVVYVAPVQPPSPITEGSEEGFSPSNNAVENSLDATTGFADTYDKLPEVKSPVSKYTKEKASATDQELEFMLKHESNKSSVGVSITSVIIIGFVGIVLGYLYKRT